MRKIEITEVDSDCYIIKTTDFQDNDAVVYHWDHLPQNFYGEYQMATLEKRQFQRDTFKFTDYPTIGDVINFIWKRDRELMEQRFRSRIPRHVDRIDVQS